MTDLLNTRSLSVDSAGVGDVEGGGSGRDGVAATPALYVPPAKLRHKVTKQMRRRRGASIRAYVGVNGAGKSFAAVRDLLPSLDAGRKVLSTVRLIDAETGEDHPLYEPLTDWQQFLEARHVDVLLDEVTGVASSRESMGMPIQVQVMLDKLRKSDISMIWTAPSFANADARIRRVTQAVTECRGYLKVLPKEAGGDIPLWPQTKLFRQRTFPMIDMDEFNKRTSAQDRRGSVTPIKAQVVEWVWGPGSRTFASYGTLDAVSRVGEVLDSGRCAHCGGRRAIPKCEC